MAEEFQYCFDNPNNPYDYVGVQHNLGLDAIAASPNFGNLTIEEAYAIAYETVANNLGVTENVPYETAEPAFALTGAAEPLLEVAQILFSDGDISEQAYNSIVELNQLFDTDDPQVFGNSVLNMEEAILQNGAYTTFELEVLLGGTSIARHSTCYWIDAALDPASPWYPYLNTNSAGDMASDRGLWDWIKKAWKKVKRFVKKDISGYKFAKKVVNQFIDGEWKKVVVSVVVGVIYSWLPI